MSVGLPAAASALPEKFKNEQAMGEQDRTDTRPWLLIETSGQIGQVGLAAAGRIVAGQSLDPQRRHARDLAAAVESLIRQSSLPPSQWAGVMVSIGPGSFTGLRVGVMSAKTFAYVTGRPLRAVPTFAAVAAQTASVADYVWVVADALRGQLYAQLFRGGGGDPQAETPLLLLSWEQWRMQVRDQAVITGPAAAVVAQRWPELPIAPPQTHLPTLAGLYAAGCRLPSLSREQLFALEPLYVRPSYAEERRLPSPSAPGIPPSSSGSC